jgi:hypothetical protein
MQFIFINLITTLAKIETRNESGRKLEFALWSRIIYTQSELGSLAAKFHIDFCRSCWTHVVNGTAIEAVYLEAVLKCS